MNFLSCLWWISLSAAVFVGGVSCASYMLEESADQAGLATAWGDYEAMQRARKKSEREALDKLLADFEKTWPRVVRQHS